MSPASVLDTRRIGWIGLRKMGLPICERLTTQGFAVTALTRNPEGRERAARANLQSKPKIGGVVASAEIYVSAISDATVLLDVVFMVGGLKKTLHASQIFVEISTVSPDASGKSPNRTSAIGVHTFDRLVVDARTRLDSQSTKS